MSATSRSNALAERLEKGAQALAALASSLTPEQWQTRIPHDNRKVGVVVHHVASVYPDRNPAGAGAGKGRADEGRDLGRHQRDELPATPRTTMAPRKKKR
jgi:hypothetical protein